MKADQWIFILGALVILAGWLGGASLILDVVANERGLEIVLLSRFVLKRIEYERVVSFRRNPSLFASFRYCALRNRILSPRLLIDLKSNWFARGLEITPADLDRFVAILMAHGIREAKL